MKTFSLWIVAALLLTACRSAKNIGSSSSLRLEFLGEFLLPQNLEFLQTKIGGLSSIDYDPVNDLYYLISDDRSERNPARFYTAKINLSEKGISSVDFVGVTSLLQKNGSLYPGRLQDSVNYPDPEALRLNQKTGTFVWANEGERLLRTGSVLLKNPSVNLMQRDGQWIDSFLLPSNLQVSAAAFGPRRNGVFEGLAFSPGFESLFVSVEEPLYQDGPRAGQGDSTAFTRMIRYDMRSKKPTAQYAYQIDAVVKPPMPTGAFSVNGVVDILSINKSQVLVTERSYSTGFTGCNVRVYIADLHNVTDVSRVESLSASQKVNLIEKRLVLDMDKLGLTIFNIEGASFGPRLPNGKRTLLFVADDNFSAAERTQFLLFAVDE